MDNKGRENMKRIRILFSIIILCFISMSNLQAFAAENELKGGRCIDYHPQKRLLVSKSPRSKIRTTILPAAYSLVENGLTTTVKSQNNDGTCWAFAYTAMAETSMIKHKAANPDINLSEKQLAYFMYHSQMDPLGNTEGDSNRSTDGLDFLMEGGNSYLTTMMLSGYCGLINEIDAPYGTSSALNKELAFLHNSVILKNAYFINASAQNDIKQALLDYGAVNCNFYYANGYYNEDNGAYFYSGGQSAEDLYQNHIICIVGWDDNYAKENFKNPPSNDGAWLAKNSWGSGKGDKGYIWISYEDTSLTDTVCATFTNASDYDHNYFYDGSASMSERNVDKDGSLANVFQVKGNASGHDEQLKSVSFGMDSTDISYSIQVYTDLKNPSDPVSGNKALDTPITGTTTYSGIYTVDLDEAVTLSQGSYYSIVITNKSDMTAAFFVDETENYGWIKCINTTHQNESFIKYDDSSVWSDMHNQTSTAYGPMTARIKGMTIDLDTTQAKELHLSQDTLSLEIGETKRLIATLYPESAQPSISWLSDDENIAVIDKEGCVTAKGQGICRITAAVDDMVQASAVIIVTKPLSKVSCPELIDMCYTGESLQPQLILKDGNTILILNQDYTYTIRDNVEIGKATVLIQGIHLYSGELIRTFRIVPKSTEGVIDPPRIEENHTNQKSEAQIIIPDEMKNDLVKKTITGTDLKKRVSCTKVKDQIYTGKKLKPVIKIKIDGRVLSKKYYTLSYKNNKQIGKATIIITFRGKYSGRIQKSFNIVPKAPKIIKVKTCKRKFTITYSKVRGNVSGYEIEYETSGKKKSCRTKKWKKTITKLKPQKKYYIRVRAYKIVKGKIYYSAYTAKKMSK